MPAGGGEPQRAVLCSELGYILCASRQPSHLVCRGEPLGLEALHKGCCCTSPRPSACYISFCMLHIRQLEHLQDNCTGAQSIASMFPPQNGYTVAPGTASGNHYPYSTFLSLQWIVPIAGGALQVMRFILAAVASRFHARNARNECQRIRLTFEVACQALLGASHKCQCACLIFLA